MIFQRVPRNIIKEIDADTKLLLHFNGNVIDSSGSPMTVTDNGTSSDTVNKVFGSASRAFSSAYLSVPDSSVWYASVFTADFRVRFNSLSNYQTLLSQYVNADNRWGIDCDSSGRLYWDIKSGGSWVFQHDEIAAGISATTWTHLAFVRDGSTWTVYVNGSSVGSYSYSGTPSFAAPLLIGKYGYPGDERYFNGQIDEFRWSSVARWSGNFTPPTTEYSKYL